MAYFRGTSLLIRKVSEVISQLADFKFWGKKGASSPDVLVYTSPNFLMSPHAGSCSHTYVRLKI